MWRLLAIVALGFGLTACGGDAVDDVEVLESERQGLACEAGTGACPGTTVCAWLPGGDEGLCRPPCIGGVCAYSGDICCTQPNGAPYCDSSCF